MWTGITPAIVHHNAWRDGLKDRRRTTWTQMWFQPYARDLLDAWAAAQKQQQQHHAKVSKRTPGNRLAMKVRRWILERRDMDDRDEDANTTKMSGLGAKTDNDEEGNWASWRDLCGDKQQEEVFRDGLGPWRGLGGKGVERKEWKNPEEEKKKEEERKQAEEKKEEEEKKKEEERKQAEEKKEEEEKKKAEEEQKKETEEEEKKKQIKEEEAAAKKQQEEEEQKQQQKAEHEGEEEEEEEEEKKSAGLTIVHNEPAR